MQRDRRRILARTLLLVMAVVFVALCYMAWRGERSMQESGTRTIAAEESDAQTTRVTLLAYENLSTGGGQASVELLRERLDRWLGAGAYDLAVGDTTIELALPASALEGSNPQDLLTKYLIRPMEPYVCDGAHLGDIVYMEDNGFHIARDDIEDAEVADGVPRKGQKSLVVTLCRETSCKLEQAVANWEEGPILWLDPGTNPSYGFDTVSFDAKRRTVTVAPSSSDEAWESDGQYYPLLAFALAQDSMVVTFDAEIREHVDWEAFDRIAFRETGSLGRGRVKADEFSEPTATLEVSYRANEADVTDRDMNQLLDMLASRLDAMNVSYALGKSVDKDGRLLVRLPASHMGDPIRAVMGADASGLRLQVGCDGFGVEGLSLLRGFGTPTLVCTVKEQDREPIADVCAKHPDSPLSLSCHGSPLFVTRCADVAGDGSVTFRSTCFDLTQDDPWLFELVDACANSCILTSTSRCPSDLW